MIAKRFFLTFVITVAVVAPAKAGSMKKAIEESGQYWQRISTSSAIYLRGPKAQQMLNRDISRCVVELRELERLGEIKDAIPPYIEDGRVLSKAEANLAGWDTPDRDDQLFAEQSNYHDFEGCMQDKGWERVKYVPFDVAKDARDNYVSSHAKNRGKKEPSSTKRGDFDHLND